MNICTARTLGDSLDEVAAQYPDSLAVVFEDQRITYRERQKQATLLAEGLFELGIKRGDKFAMRVSTKHFHDLVSRRPFLEQENQLCAPHLRHRRRALQAFEFLWRRFIVPMSHMGCDPIVSHGLVSE